MGIASVYIDTYLFSEAPLDTRNHNSPSVVSLYDETPVKATALRVHLLPENLTLKFCDRNNANRTRYPEEVLVIKH
jgi:hypothetical protein